MAGCSPAEEKQMAQHSPRPVRIETIASRDLPIIVRAVGRLVPNREVVVSAQVPGIVMRMHADVGTRVASGSPLVKLDDTDYVLALNEATANQSAAMARFTAAQNSFERAKRLLSDRVATPELYEAAQAAYLVAQAQTAQLKAMVDIARRQLNKTVIDAPFDGHITRRWVELGKNVAVGEPVMALADMQTMRVEIHINELDYMRLDKEDPVTVVIESDSDTPFPGRVDKIGLQADSRTNTFAVEILVDNPRFVLKAGLTARVFVQTEMIPDAVLIPQDCVLFREDRKEVFVVEAGNKAVAREITPGRAEGSVVRIRKGLMPGDKLVISGGQYLKTGDEVALLP
jgi:RND family efflux transporter MFP subunit